MKNFLLTLIYFIPVFNIFGQAITISPGIIGSNQDINYSYNLELKSQNGGIPNISGIAQNGTFITPTAVLANNLLLSIWGRGFDGSNITTSRARIDFRASENWTTTNNGSSMTFSTTPNGSTNRTERMRIENDGNVGIGTTNPLASLEVVRGTGINGTAAFQGTTNASHFNYSTAENTYIRGGKIGANVIISDVSGNVAVGNGVPLEKLHVFGNIRSSSLAGTGVRNVYADANGTLTTATQTSYVSLPPSAFFESLAPPASKQSNDVTLYYTDAGFSRTLYCPINLPHGATLTNVKINYLDQSTQTSTFSLVVSALDGTNPTITSLGSSTNAISGSTSTAISQGIDNSSNGYVLKIVFNSDNGNMRLNGAILTYTK